LELVLKLEPVTYHLDIDAINSFVNTPDSLRLKDAEQQKERELQIGFIAQDVEKAAKEIGFDFHAVDKPKNNNDFYGLRYSEFIPVLVKAIQEQQVIIEKQKRNILKFEKIIQNQSLKIERLEKRLNKLENK